MHYVKVKVRVLSKELRERLGINDIISVKQVAMVLAFAAKRRQ